MNPMPNLVKAINEMNNVRQEAIKRHEAELKQINDAILLLQKYNTACTLCDGVGKRLRSRACAEDDRPDPNDPSDWITCPACNGTGQALLKKKE